MEVPTERMNLPGDFLQEHEDIQEKAKCSLPKSWRYPKNAGWFINYNGKSIYKWMMTGGTPMDWRPPFRSFIHADFARWSATASGDEKPQRKRWSAEAHHWVWIIGSLWIEFIEEIPKAMWTFHPVWRKNDFILEMQKPPFLAVFTGRHDSCSKTAKAGMRNLFGFTLFLFYHLLSSSALQCFLPLPSQKQFLCDPNTQNFCCPNFYMFKFKQGHVKCSVFASCFAERCILRVPILGGFNMPFGSSKADRENECENDHRPVREAERRFRGTEWRELSFTGVAEIFSEMVWGGKRWDIISKYNYV